MVIIIVEQVPDALRGELSRWLLEPRRGVFIGRLSALVRDLLWEKAIANAKTGGIFQAWSTNTEQGFAMRSYGDTSRIVVETEGLFLVQTPHPEPAKQNKKLQLKLKRLQRLINPITDTPTTPYIPPDDIPF